MLAAAASLAVRSAAAQEAAPPGRAEAVRIIGDLRKIVAPEGIERWRR
jgi:hypothetical protein